MADPVTEFAMAVLWLVIIVGGGLMIVLGILYLIATAGESFTKFIFGDPATVTALKTSIIGTNRSEVVAKLNVYSGTNLGIHPPKVRVILRELTEHPEQHYEEIDFLIDNQLTIAEMLDLIDRSELEDWHIARSQLYV